MLQALDVHVTVYRSARTDRNFAPGRGHAHRPCRTLVAPLRPPALAEEVPEHEDDEQRAGGDHHDFNGVHGVTTRSPRPAHETGAGAGCS